MTLNALNRVQYSGDGSTTTFSITFKMWDKDDPEVIHTDSSGTETAWTRGTQYTIALSGAVPATGTLSVNTTPTDYTPAASTKLTIRSNMAETQATAITVGGSLPSQTVEQMVDKAVRVAQQVSEEVGRSLKFRKSSTQADITFPEPEAGKIPRWNSAADGMENVTGTAAASSPTSVADGGTGGTTVATALTNLGIKLAAQRVSLWKLGQF